MICLWLKIFFLKLIMIMYDHKEWYDWLIRISFIYIIIEIIYELEDDMNWQSGYIKDPINGGIYVGKWFVLRIYVTSETSDMSPDRSATNRQRDQRFRRTLLPDDSQPTAKRYVILWSCHRKNIVIVHGW